MKEGIRSSINTRLRGKTSKDKKIPSTSPLNNKQRCKTTKEVSLSPESSTVLSSNLKVIKANEKSQQNSKKESPKNTDIPPLAKSKKQSLTSPNLLKTVEVQDINNDPKMLMLGQQSLTNIITPNVTNISKEPSQLESLLSKASQETPTIIENKSNTIEDYNKIARINDMNVLPLLILPDKRAPESLHNNSALPVQNDTKTTKVSRGIRTSSNYSTERRVKAIKPVEENPDPHTDVNKPVNCFICHQLFSSFSEMQNHYLNNHKSKRKSKFDQEISNPGTTENTQITDKNLQIEPKGQKKRKTKTDTNKCAICSISFKTKNDVKNHMNEVHSYVCTYCKNKFFNLYDFTNHKCSKKCTKKPKETNLLKTTGKNLLGREKPNVEATQNRFVYIRPKEPNPILNIINKSLNQAKESAITQRIVKENNCIQGIPILVNAQVTPQIAMTPINSIVDNMRNETVISNTSMRNNVSIVNINKSQIQATQNSEPVNKNVLNTQKLNEDIDSVRDKFKNTENDKNDSLSDSINSHKQNNKEKLDIDKKSLSNKSKNNANKESLNQVINNPNITVSVLPKKTLSVDTEFTCVRCNVLCEDMEDYVDHIQDCLNYSGVSVEPVEQFQSMRILKLKNQSTFSYKDKTDKDMPCLINPVLIEKLKNVLSPNNEKQFQNKQSNWSKDLCPTTTFIKTSSMDTSATNTLKNYKSTGHSFRDLLDDDINYSANSRIKQEIKENEEEEEKTHKTTKSFKKNYRPTANEVSENVQTNSGNTINKGVMISNKTTSPPMVVIPLHNNPERLAEPLPHARDTSLQSSTSGDATTSLATSSPLSSPLGLLLDVDDIKMEVEDEIIEDYA